MRKFIMFIVVALTVLFAAIEYATVGLPEINYVTLAICGVCVGLGLLYLKLTMHKLSDLMWCLSGGLVLTMFVLVGGHVVNLLPVAIDYFHLGALVSMLLGMVAAMVMVMVYGFSLYLFLFYFCKFKSKIVYD